MKEYVVIYEWAGSNYSAYVPDLPGCVACADTLEETQGLMKEAIELYIQTLKEESLGHLAEDEKPDKVERSVFYPLRPISAGRLANLYAQLAELLKAGVGIHEAVDALTGRVGGRRLARILAEVSPKLAAGEDLSGILAKYPQIFPADVRAMLQAGEISGNLDQACAAIAAQCDEEHDLRRKLCLPRLYYGLVLILCILIPSLPWIISRGFSWYVDLLVTMLLPIIAGLIALVLIVKVVAAIPWVKGVVDDVIFALPWLAPFAMRGARARMLQTLYILMRAGVDMPTSLNLAAQASGLRPMEAQLRIAAAKIREEVPVTQALADCSGLSAQTKGALATAQQTGLYEEALARLAEAAVTERRNVTNKILIGSLVGSVVFAAVPVAVAVCFGYRAYIESIFERAGEWMP